MEGPQVHSTSIIQANPKYACKPHGILKLVQTVMNIICVSLIGAYFRGKPDEDSMGVIFFNSEHLFFFLMSVTFLIGTLVIVISGFLSSELAINMANSAYEMIYHMAGAILFFCSSIAVISRGAKDKDAYHQLTQHGVEIVLSAGAMGLFNTLLYSASVALSFLVTAR